MNKEILKVIVGSQAHGLATPESDFDYRGVFVTPTSEILRIGGKVHETSWIEGQEDNTSWELGHFLQMATKSNPTILETFLSPLAKLDGVTSLTRELQALFPHVWSSQGVADAFIGYSHNQRKKFLDNKDNRASKYAAVAARVLYNAWELLTTGTFTIRIADTPVGEVVRSFKEGRYEHGAVMQHIHYWEGMVRQAFNDNPKKEVNLEVVNEFLLKVRRSNW